MAAETEEVSNAEITEAPGSTNGMGHNSFRDESATQASSLTASQQNSDDEYEGSHHSESTWLSRAQSRTEELRKLFHLPPGENVCDEFVCALRKRILLQGRLYICEHYICFYSHLFGYNKEKVIPLKEVTNVRKRRHCGFPNSIEIIWRGGKHEFFTSFLSRDDAYRLVMMAWHQNSGYAKLFGALSPAASVHYHHRSALQKVSGAIARSSIISGGGGGGAGSAGSTSPDRGLSDTEKGAEGKRSRLGQIINTLASGHIHPVGTRRSIFQNGGDRDKGEDHDDDDVSSQGSASSFVERKARIAARHVAPSAISMDESEPYSSNHNDSDIASDADSDAGGDDVADWAPQAGPPPPVATECTPLARGVLNADVREVFHRLLADERFFRTFHEGRDDRDVRVSPWRQHPAMGRVRELTFVSPVKMRMGISPSSAHCHQTQRYRLFEGGQHLVLESSQTMNDIPFGDHFTVESRWDFSIMDPGQDGAPRTLAVNHVKIPFSKHTIWKKAIEKGTLDSCRESHEDLLTKARKVVAAVPAALATIRSSSSAAAAANGAAAAAATPFADAGAARPPPASLQGASGGTGATAAGGSGESPDVQELLSRIPPGYRADVARMLLNSQEGPAKGGSGVARAISRMQSSARLRSNDVEGAPHVPSRGGTGVLAMVTAAWDWLHTCEPRYILMGAVLLAILVLQVIILAGVGWGAVNTRVTTLLGDPVPNQAQWAQRMEVMQLEAAALSQRLEILNAELAAAAQLLLNKSADVA